VYKNMDLIEVDSRMMVARSWEEWGGIEKVW
jgi:hypothetical protein